MNAKTTTSEYLLVFRNTSWHTDLSPEEIKQNMARFTSSARTALLSSFPDTKQVEFRWRGNASKPKGLGSLGQMRFFAFVEWRGGPIAREVKLSRPSAWAWAQGKTSAGNAIMTLIHKAVRSPDPLVSMHENWLVRAIAAECGRIDPDEVDKAGTDAAWKQYWQKVKK